MKTTRYFNEQVLRKRPYINPAWCVEVIAAPLRREPSRTVVSASGVRSTPAAQPASAFSGW